VDTIVAIALGAFKMTSPDGYPGCALRATPCAQYATSLKHGYSSEK
jgi:hypothetical protein